MINQIIPSPIIKSNVRNNALSKPNGVSAYSEIINSPVSASSYRAYSGINSVSFKGIQSIENKTFEETLTHVLKLAKYGKQELFKKPVKVTINGEMVNIPNFYSEINESVQNLKDSKPVNDICNKLSEIYGRFLEEKYPDKIFMPIWDSSKDKFGVLHTYLAAFDKNDFSPAELKEFASRDFLKKFPLQNQKDFFRNATFIDPSDKTFGKFGDSNFRDYNHSHMINLDTLSDVNKGGLFLIPNQPIILGPIKDYLTPEIFSVLRYEGGAQRYNEKTQLLLVFDKAKRFFNPVTANSETKINLLSQETKNDINLLRYLLAHQDGNLKDLCFNEIPYKPLR